MKKTCTKRLRQSILGDVGEAAQKSPLPRHILVMPKPLSRNIEVGSFYEIDHSKLPLGTPAELRSIRLVMVTAKTELNVTVRYPSTQSLEAYLGNAECVALRTKLYPTLDEKFVMEPNLAVDVLGHEIPSREFGEHGHTKSFWLMGSFGTDRELHSPISVCNVAADSKAKNGSLLFNLKGWGFQRVVAYLREPIAHQEVTSLSDREGRRNMEEEESHENKDKEVIQYTRKRKCGRPAADHIKKMKHSPKPKPVEFKPKIKAAKEKEYIDRWPTKRYEAAAKKLWEVLKDNRAVYGNPISRFELRAQARNRIGDTGLLDHLLKHLAGKVVSDCNERLRRRCDAEGKMEYWLESADLVHIRKEAGVQDPYWTPPPGWKPGDCMGSQDCLCRQEMRLLKQELNNMRRHIEELKSKDEDEGALTETVVLPCSTTSSGRLNGGNLKMTSLKEMYEALLKKKSIMEEQLVEISKALLGLEEDMKMLTQLAEAPENATTTGIADFEGGEVSESDGEGERTSLTKLKPCRRQDDPSNLLSSSSQAVEDRMVSASPNSTTTSFTSH